MRHAGWAIILLLASSARAEVDVERPLRVVIRKVANCLFSTVEIPPRAPHDTATRDDFDAGEPLYARCYLPERAGANRPGDLVDEFLLDGKPLWTQSYDQALPADALERSIVLGEVLRTPLKTVARGSHRITMMGKLRRGGRMIQVYRGELRYYAP